MPTSNPCQCQKVIDLFNDLFTASYNTLLVCAVCDGRQGELDQPVYEPASHHRAHHQIVFAHGHFASALHEISHWCVAGDARRLLEDFGYWYRPDGRSKQQQKEFEKVEIKPQALEWLFSLASRQVFVASADNLTAGISDDHAFRLAVSSQARFFLTHDLPPQAALWLAQLKQAYGGQVLLEHLYWPDEEVEFERPSIT